MAVVVQQPRSGKPKVQVVDRVRISKAKRQFKKGYMGSWSEELVTIGEAQPFDPPAYMLVDDAAAEGQTVPHRDGSAELEGGEDCGDAHEVVRLPGVIQQLDRRQSARGV